MSRLSTLLIVCAMLAGAPLSSQAISVTGATQSTVAGAASASSASGSTGNTGAPSAPAHFQLKGTITNVNGDAGTFQVNGVTMTLVSGAAILAANGQPLHSLADLKSGQTVQVTLAEVKTGDPTHGRRTAYSVRVIR